MAASPADSASVSGVLSMDCEGPGAGGEFSGAGAGEGSSGSEGAGLTGVGEGDEVDSAGSVVGLGKPWAGSAKEGSAATVGSSLEFGGAVAAGCIDVSTSERAKRTIAPQLLRDFTKPRPPKCSFNSSRLLFCSPALSQNLRLPQQLYRPEDRNRKLLNRCLICRTDSQKKFHTLHKSIE